MSSTALFRRLSGILSDILGLGLSELIGVNERIQHVRATAMIGLVVGAVFASFNLATEGMAALGLVQAAALVCLVVPAWLLSRFGVWIRLAESLILLAAALIFLALIVFGGIAGTGLFWVYSFPFLVFFLKGQKFGWWYSAVFAGVVAAYFVWGAPMLPFAYPYPPVYAAHFLLALGFYMLIASAFNLLRSRFEAQLQARVVEKTAAAKAYLDQLQFLATHDSLTQLPNRVRLLELLRDQCDEAAASGQGLLVCSLRLERLLELGNVLGMAGADDLVMQVVEHLRRSSQGQAVLARARRDEFIMVYRLDEPTVQADRLQKFVVGHPMSAQEHGYTLHVELTMGLSVFPIHSGDPELLLQKAEQAMLQARKSGLSWSLYDERLDELFVRHHLLFGKLREAIADGHLQVHYQPQIDLRSGRVVGAEALARWHDPEEGMISPAVFIPVAEDSGLIRPLTEWVARASMRECARWRTLGLEIDISINISALSLLDPELLDILVAAAREAGLPTGSINLELTESCFMGSPERSMAVMKRLHEAGFRLSIDDFGTGYSSLSYLKFLPINELKIDQSFVRNLLDNPGDQAIVVSTVELAHNFALTVVAEGIEDAGTAAWLKDCRCETGQGFGFARALPADDFVAYARQVDIDVATESRA